MKRSLYLVLFILLSINHAFGGENWKLELDKDGIKVYTRTTSMSEFKEFRGETHINASIEEVEAVLTNIKSYPKWCYKTTSASITEQDSSTIRYFYISDTPRFLKTRVGCFELRRESNRETKEVLFYLDNIQCSKPLTSDMLLIPIMKGYWKLKPSEGGGVDITMQMLTEPGGVIPSWLANMVVVDSPYVTLKNLSSMFKPKVIK